MDYTLREEEIAAKLTSSKNKGTAAKNPDKLPKRLRGEIVTLIQKLQKRHQRCAYVELLRHYCPTKVCMTVHMLAPVLRVSCP